MIVLIRSSPILVMPLRPYLIVLLAISGEKVNRDSLISGAETLTPVDEIFPIADAILP